DGRLCLAGTARTLLLRGSPRLPTQPVPEYDPQLPRRLEAVSAVCVGAPEEARNQTAGEGPARAAGPRLPDGSGTNARQLDPDAQPPPGGAPESVRVHRVSGTAAAGPLLPDQHDSPQARRGVTGGPLLGKGGGQRPSGRGCPRNSSGPARLRPAAVPVQHRRPRPGSGGHADRLANAGATLPG